MRNYKFNIAMVEKKVLCQQACLADIVFAIFVNRAGLPIIVLAMAVHAGWRQSRVGIGSITEACMTKWKANGEGKK